MFRSSSSASSKLLPVGRCPLDVESLAVSAPVSAQSPYPIVDPRKRLPRFLHSFPGEIQRQPVMHAQKRVTNFASGVSLREHIAQGIKIAERLRHLLSVDQEMRAVQPVAHKFFARCTLPFARSPLRDAGRCCPRRRNEYRVARRGVAVAIALHSICQPGRPGPHGLSQPTEPSASSHAFQSAKSPTCSFSYSSFFTRPVDCSCGEIEVRELSVVREIS